MIAAASDAMAFQTAAKRTTAADVDREHHVLAAMVYPTAARRSYVARAVVAIPCAEIAPPRVASRLSVATQALNASNSALTTT